MKSKKIGRPSDYTLELAEEICTRIASTNLGIKKLCKENTHWPSYETIYSWLRKYNEFADLYAQAKRFQVEILIDEILDIADSSSNDRVINEDGKSIIDHEHINRSRLRIDTRKWLAAKLCPRLYGDKEEHVNLKFPNDLTKGSSVLPMSAEVLRALANQEISPEQAKILLSSLRDHGANIATGDFDQRLTELEGKQNAQS